MPNFESNPDLYAIGILNGLLTLVTFLLLMRVSLKPKALLVPSRENRARDSGANM